MASSTGSKLSDQSESQVLTSTGVFLKQGISKDRETNNAFDLPITSAVMVIEDGSCVV